MNSNLWSREWRRVFVGLFLSLSIVLMLLTLFHGDVLDVVAGNLGKLDIVASNFEESAVEDKDLAIEDLVQTFAFFILIILLALFILRWRLEGFRKELVLVFLLGTAVMLMLFWFPPVDICPEGGKTPCFEQVPENYGKKRVTMGEFTICGKGDTRKKCTEDNSHNIGFVEQLIIEEHKKAVTEIKLKIEREEDWFHYKFLLVGGLFGALLFVAPQFISKQPNSMGSTLNRLIEPIVVICLVLAVATCIALVIDAHVRSIVSGVAQLGVWIHRHIEDPFLLEQGLLGWETFIRHGHGVKNTGGMHTDVIWRFTWPQLHVISWLLYSIYLLLLFQAWKQIKIDKGRGGVYNGLIGMDRDDRHNRLKLQRQWLIISFGFVHVLLCGFAWMAHSYPSAFSTQPWPWSSVYVQSQLHQPLLYVLLSAILTITVGLYLKILDNEPHRRTTDGHG